MGKTATDKLKDLAYAGLEGVPFLSKVLPPRENDFGRHLEDVSYGLPSDEMKTSEKPLKFVGGFSVEASENDELWKVASR